jgi:hypothetical protein
MPRPQFSLKTLLWLTAVVGVACWWLGLAWKALAPSWWAVILFWRPAYAGVVLAIGAIGACAGIARGKPTTGMALGLFLALVASFAIVFALAARALLAGAGVS